VAGKIGRAEESSKEIEVRRSAWKKVGRCCARKKTALYGGCRGKERSSRGGKKRGAGRGLRDRLRPLRLRVVYMSVQSFVCRAGGAPLRTDLGHAVGRKAWE